MFSQLRNAVEHLAQHPVRVTDASSPENHSEPPARSGSLDLQATRSTSPLSSSELAESALSSLRKSLASQRSGTSSQPSRPPSSPSPPDNSRARKSNLEERLRRATFAIGEASGSSTPNRSSRVASPSPMGSDRKPMKQDQSPNSIPLPASPMITPAMEREARLEQPSNLSLQETDISSLEETTLKDEQVTSETVTESPPLAQPQLSAELKSIEKDASTSSSSDQIQAEDPGPPLQGEATEPPPKEQDSTTTVKPLDVQEKFQASTPGNEAAVIEEIRPTANEESPAKEEPPANQEHPIKEESLGEEGPTVEEELMEEPTIKEEPAVKEELAVKEEPTLEKEPEVKEKFTVKEEPTVKEGLSIIQSIKSLANLDPPPHLQARLKQVEQRFSDVSTSFKRLQAEKLAADASIKDSNALREFFSDIKTKEQVFQEELKRLNQKLELQEDRIEEMRDTHRLESHSRSAEVKKLRTQLDETESLFQAAQRATTHAEDLADKKVEKSKTTAKEEEEKRVKAISLLKTVRQKLGDKDKEQAERLNFQHEMDNLTASHEKAAANLKAQFGKDFANMRERYEQEISALRGQFELDLASSKNSLNNVTRDKNAFFDQLQLRQAKWKHQNTELQFQLRESNDRVALLKEECAELLREHEIARMVSATEAKYEAKLAEVKRNLAILEKERYESEADWSRKLKEKVRDLEDLKRVLGSATKTREADENVVANLKSELEQAQQTAKSLERQVSELPLLREQVHELQKSLKEQEQETSIKIRVLEKQLEETKLTLREELRKVQSSAALLERQRNPGVGYWTTRVAEGNGSAAEPRTSNVSSQSGPPSRVSSPTPSTATSSKNEEEVNLEYLRNVIFQFLEHKEMRPNLVRVLSIILHFTPQETRRLIAKV
ncbi:hypothetical protein BDZ97DRAFT_1777816 [Flammula alnicola]|nr:hypothetical protein BDZ97DRAFT_1777816 [Flammula alnicola]